VKIITGRQRENKLVEPIFRNPVYATKRLSASCFYKTIIHSQNHLVIMIIT
jgi:hypothetical protein